MVVATPALLAGAVAQLKRASPRTAVLVEEGDLSRLLPRLRVGELDFIVGRLEPGYAAPDLETEALYDEAMRVVVAPEHALARRRSIQWSDLAQWPWVVPPAWASSRLKLNQLFYMHGLQPPADIVETASFLVTLTFLRQRRCVGFVAQEVAAFMAREKLARALRVEVSIELPPVGLIRLRGGLRTPSVEHLAAALREQARSRLPP